MSGKPIPPTKEAGVTILWIVLVVILVLALLGFLVRRRFHIRIELRTHASPSEDKAA